MILFLHILYIIDIYITLLFYDTAYRHEQPYKLRAHGNSILDIQEIYNMQSHYIWRKFGSFSRVHKNVHKTVGFHINNDSQRMYNIKLLKMMLGKIKVNSITFILYAK